MDWEQDEINRRMNEGQSLHSANDVRGEYEYHSRVVEREERKRILEEENNVSLKKQVKELESANRILDEQNIQLKEANHKLQTQIEDFRKEAKSSKRISIISIAIAAASLAAAIVAICLRL